MLVLYFNQIRLFREYDKYHRLFIILMVSHNLLLKKLNKKMNSLFHSKQMLATYIDLVVFDKP